MINSVAETVDTETSFDDFYSFLFFTGVCRVRALQSQQSIGGIRSHGRIAFIVSSLKTVSGHLQRTHTEVALIYSVFEYAKPLEASEQIDLSIKVSKIEGKGEGVIATRNFKPGEVIFQEHALLKLAIAEVQHDKIVMAPAQLTDAQRDMYFHLHNCYTAEEGYPGPPKSQTLGIWHTNAFDTHADQQVVVIGRTSKMNHSCRPNASLWCEETDTWTLVAAGYIQAGQEITCTYLHLLKDSDSRRRIALKSWGFLCQCEVCSLPADLLEQNDMRRA